jgi:hypothetical protein
MWWYVLLCQYLLVKLKARITSFQRLEALIHFRLFEYQIDTA